MKFHACSCGKVHIGETKRQLETRMKEHHAAVRLGHSAVAEYAWPGGTIGVVFIYWTELLHCKKLMAILTHKYGCLGCRFLFSQHLALIGYGKSEECVGYPPIIQIIEQ